MTEWLKGPIFFERNRVGRVYLGGALFGEFFGDEPEDGFLPEEWIASSVAAINKDSLGPKEGVSRVAGTDWYFDDLLAAYPRELLGDRDSFGVLVKVLDSAIRLPAQAHPDKAFSRQYFDSEYGKAESWLVLATRPDAKIYFGFKEAITKEAFAAAVEASERDKSVMEPLMNAIPVKTGDVFFVPARMAHAIGAGCLILEVQEPTDFTIQPEYWCGDYHLNEQEMYIGLPADTALDVFDYSLYGKAAVAAGRRLPRKLREQEGVWVEELISAADTPCFGVQRHTLCQSTEVLTDAPAVYVVTDGTGYVEANGESRPLKKGDYFFLPYAAAGHTRLVTERAIQVVACLPPQK